MNGNDNNNNQNPRPVAYDDSNPVHRGLAAQKMQMIGATAALTIITSVISGYTTFYLTKESPERKLELQVAELTNSVQQNSEQIKTLIKQVGMRLPSNLADEKFGRLDDKIETLNGRIVITRDMVKENRESIQRYMYRESQSNNAWDMPGVYEDSRLAYNISYSYKCDSVVPGLPHLPEQPGHPDGFILSLRTPFEKKIDNIELII